MTTTAVDLPMTEGGTWRLRHTAGITACAAGIVAVGILIPRVIDDQGGGVTHARLFAWLVIAVLLAAFTAVVGAGITGMWRGVLVDNRHRMSLSRLQMALWTLLVLSTYLAAALANVGLGDPHPLNVSIPSELWIVMGISTASLVAAPAALAVKRRDDDSNPDVNVDPASSGWRELVTGEEPGKRHEIDLAKIQMLLFTAILILAYAVAVGDSFAHDKLRVHALPTIDDAVVVLLAISHAGYVAKKAAPEPPSAETVTQAAAQQP